MGERETDGASQAIQWFSGGMVLMGGIVMLSRGNTVVGIVMIAAVVLGAIIRIFMSS